MRRFRGTERKARRRVEQAKNFPDDIEDIGCVAPPVCGVEFVVGDSADDGMTGGRSEMAPEKRGAASVDLGGDEDDAAAGLRGEGGGDGLHFVGGVDDRGIQYFDGSCGNALVNQDLPIVLFFADIGNGKARHGGAGFQRVGQPDTTGITLFVDTRGLEGALRHVPTEDGDGGRRLERVLNDEPFTDVKKNQNTTKKDTAEQRGPEQSPASVGGWKKAG